MKTKPACNQKSKHLLFSCWNPQLRFRCKEHFKERHLRRTFHLLSDWQRFRNGWCLNLKKKIILIIWIYWDFKPLSLYPVQDNYSSLSRTTSFMGASLFAILQPHNVLFFGKFEKWSMPHCYAPSFYCLKLFVAFDVEPCTTNCAKQNLKEIMVKLYFYYALNTFQIFYLDIMTKHLTTSMIIVKLFKLGIWEILCIFVPHGIRNKDYTASSSWNVHRNNVCSLMPLSNLERTQTFYSFSISLGSFWQNIWMVLYSELVKSTLSGECPDIQQGRDYSKSWMLNCFATHLKPLILCVRTLLYWNTQLCPYYNSPAFYL